MATPFGDIINKILDWIKTNGNREITAAQLREILIDVANNLTEEVPAGTIPFFSDDENFVGGPEYDSTTGKLSTTALGLQFGAALVNYIYNSGAFTGSASRSLITKDYHDKFHKNNQWADIAVVTSLDPANYKSGDIVDEQELTEGQIVLFMDQWNAANNGIYIIGEESSSKLDTYFENTAVSVAVINPKSGYSHSYVIGDDNLVSEGQVSGDQIAGYVKIAAQISILNL